MSLKSVFGLSVEALEFQTFPKCDVIFSSSPEEMQADRLERSSSISEDYLRYLNNPQHTEKRFPVDRKKLERLIIGEGCVGVKVCGCVGGGCVESVGCVL